jgi:hypothetical protein
MSLILMSHKFVKFCVLNRHVARATNGHVWTINVN